MKLLLDQGLPRSAASLLREHDIDAVHTGEIGYATAEDAAIIAYARNETRIIVTLDSDFHSLLALSNASSPSVIRIRIERLKAEACAELILILLEDWRDELESGVMLTVQPGRVRVHDLPILP
ncbi:DUF5615 family PIN-like protein [Chloroflexi bacterium TSY]|nr:DUF5615 family PIN-like protein [Chloroflexi bacterium TSY]